MLPALVQAFGCAREHDPGTSPSRHGQLDSEAVTLASPLKGDASADRSMGDSYGRDAVVDDRSNVKRGPARGGGTQPADALLYPASDGPQEVVVVGPRVLVPVFKESLRPVPFQTPQPGRVC